MKNKSTLAKEVMRSDPVAIAPECTLQEAAQKMAEIDCGILPVVTNGRIDGIITDRDIVIRAVAQGCDVREPVRDHMTQGAVFCRDTDTLEQVGQQMHEHNVNRLLVKNASGEVCGILTFGCIMRKDRNTEEVGKVVDVATGKKAA